MSELQQVATYLIIYRVADGTAWTKKTMSTALTSMQFNTRNGAGKRGGTDTLQLTMDSSRTGVDVVGDVDSPELGEKGAGNK